MSMDYDTKLDQLAKRKKELKKILANLDDIKDWFEKYPELNIDPESFDDAITELDDIIDDVDGELEALTESDPRSMGWVGDDGLP